MVLLVASMGGQPEALLLVMTAGTEGIGLYTPAPCRLLRAWCSLCLFLAGSALSCSAAFSRLPLSVIQPPAGTVMGFHLTRLGCHNLCIHTARVTSLSILQNALFVHLSVSADIGACTLQMLAYKNRQYCVSWRFTSKLVLSASQTFWFQQGKMGYSFHHDTFRMHDMDLKFNTVFQCWLLGFSGSERGDIKQVR